MSAVRRSSVGNGDDMQKRVLLLCTSSPISHVQCINIRPMIVANMLESLFCKRAGAEPNASSDALTTRRL